LTRLMACDEKSAARSGEVGFTGSCVTGNGR
jgi:hypothetical protein